MTLVSMRLVLPSRVLPKTFLAACRTRIPRCQRCNATERVSPGLNDNILRYTNSFVTHGAVPAQYEPPSGR